MDKKRAIKGFLLSFVFLVSFVYMISGVQWVFENPLQNQVVLGDVSGASVQVPVQSIAPIVSAEDPKPDINAESAISVESNLDGTNKILFEKDSGIKLPIASLTKLMTAVIVLDNYNLSDSVTVGKIADSQNPVKPDVKMGDTMPAESFLDIMLVGSSNKSAYALAEGPGGYPGEPVFVGLMNQKAKEIGLQNTFFADPTGLSSRNVSTASDLIKLAEYILKNYPKIADISKEKEFSVPGFGVVKNTDQLLQDFPAAVFSKTGFTKEAKGCLLLVVNNPKNNDYLISVILGADDRFGEMKKIIDWVGKQ